MALWEPVISQSFTRSEDDLQDEALIDAAVSLLRMTTACSYTVAISSLCVALSQVMEPHKAWLICGRPWASVALKLAGVDLRVHNAHRLVGPALFIANHQSFLDVVLMPATVPANTKWIAKAEFKKVPILGRAFAACAIYIERKKKGKALENIEAGLKELPEDWSVAIFPEGTRSPDGQLQDFKKGAFYMALQSRLPIIPIGIAGPRKIMGRNIWAMQSGAVHVSIGEPIATDTWHMDELADRTEQMREAVGACIKEAKRQQSVEY